LCVSTLDNQLIPDKYFVKKPRKEILDLTGFQNLSGLNSHAQTLKCHGLVSSLLETKMGVYPYPPTLKVLFPMVIRSITTFGIPSFSLRMSSFLVKFGLLRSYQPSWDFEHSI